MYLQVRDDLIFWRMISDSESLKTERPYLKQLCLSASLHAKWRFDMHRLIWNASNVTIFNTIGYWPSSYLNILCQQGLNTFSLNLIVFADELEHQDLLFGLGGGCYMLRRRKRRKARTSSRARVSIGLIKTLSKTDC